MSFIIKAFYKSECDQAVNEYFKHAKNINELTTSLNETVNTIYKTKVSKSLFFDGIKKETIRSCTEQYIRERKAEEIISFIICSEKNPETKIQCKYLNEEEKKFITSVQKEFYNHINNNKFVNTTKLINFNYTIFPEIFNNCEIQKDYLNNYIIKNIIYQTKINEKSEELINYFNERYINKNYYDTYYSVTKNSNISYDDKINLIQNSIKSASNDIEYHSKFLDPEKKDTLDEKKVKEHETFVEEKKINKRYLEDLMILPDLQSF